MRSKAIRLGLSVWDVMDFLVLISIITVTLTILPHRFWWLAPFVVVGESEAFAWVVGRRLGLRKTLALAFVVLSMLVVVRFL